MKWFKRVFKCRIKKSRLWIPALGIVIALGFFHNCVIAPHVICKTIDWTNLILAFSIVIGLGGARDVVLRKFNYLGEVKTSVKKNTLSNKVWIPFIGWCLVLGFANNFLLVPYTNLPEVEWSGLMAALSIMLTVSGARDYGIYAQERKKTSSSANTSESEVAAAEENT